MLNARVTRLESPVDAPVVGLTGQCYSHSMKILFVTFCVSLFALPVQADWEAKVKVDGKAKVPAAVGEGKMRIKGKKMRFDIKSPMDLSVIGDSAKRKAWTLIHAPRMVMESSLSESDLKNIPLCDEKGAEVCLREAGYKKTGTEKVNGYATTIYEADLRSPKVKVPTRVKLWKVDGMKEMPVTRVHAFEAGKTEPVSTMDLTEIKVGPIADAVFTVPKGYSSMPGAELFLKGMGQSNRDRKSVV